MYPGNWWFLMEYIVLILLSPMLNVISAVVKNENDPVVAYNEQHADDPKQFEIRVSIFGKKNG